MNVSKPCGPIPAAILSIFVAVLAGCKNTPPPQVKADYSATLNKYYEGRPLCIWQDTVKFPIRDASQDQIDKLGLDALASAGLLEARTAHGPHHATTTTFDLTAAGRSALTPDVFTPGAGNFCYGRRTVVSIDSAKRNSSTTELVNFHYHVANPAAWASAPAVEDEFPHVDDDLAGPHTAEATLLDTTDGWEVSGTPATIVPLATRPHRSVVAKARSFLHHLRKKRG